MSRNPDVVSEVTFPVFSHLSSYCETALLLALTHRHKHISRSIYVSQITCLLISGQSTQCAVEKKRCFFPFLTRSAAASCRASSSGTLTAQSRDADE